MSSLTRDCNIEIFFISESIMEALVSATDGLKEDILTGDGDPTAISLLFKSTSKHAYYEMRLLTVMGHEVVP
jgi:hypothetical protein